MLILSCEHFILCSHLNFWISAFFPSKDENLQLYLIFLSPTTPYVFCGLNEFLASGGQRFPTTNVLFQLAQVNTSQTEFLTLVTQMCPNIHEVNDSVPALTIA